MADQGDHGIPYVHITWNVCRGCSPVSPGCANCFAPRSTARISGEGKAYAGLVKSTSVGPHWTGEVRLAADILDLPLRMKTPKRIYVTVTGDPFHEKFTDDEIDAWLGGVAAAPWHTFICTTKRAERMRHHMSTIRDRAGKRFLIPALIGHAAAMATERGHKTASDHLHRAANKAAGHDVWPLPQLHLGVSVENQATFDERWPLLAVTPATVRWISYEPALEHVNVESAVQPIEFTACGLHGSEKTTRAVAALARAAAAEAGMAMPLDWLVIGGESGPGARPFDLAWARSAIAQCRVAGVPVFMKQMGAFPVWDGCGLVANNPPNGSELVVIREKVTDSDGYRPVVEVQKLRLTLRDRKGADPVEWPPDLRIREFPVCPQ